MKNIQVIDGALNSVFEIYAVSDDTFRIMFPKGTNVAFIRDVEKAFRARGITDVQVYNRLYKHRIQKKRAAGIDGTLHLTASPVSKKYFPSRRESDVERRQGPN